MKNEINIEDMFQNMCIVKPTPELLLRLREVIEEKTPEMVSTAYARWAELDRTKAAITPTEKRRGRKPGVQKDPAADKNEAAKSEEDSSKETSAGTVSADKSGSTLKDNGMQEEGSEPAK